MPHDRKDLEALFSPAPEEYGTHLLICGLSADTETLERIVSAFTCETKVQRAASGVLRAVLALDASAPLLGPLTIPGLLQLAPCTSDDWTKKTSLMHAKVALMGFSKARFATPTSFRLVVSTGNWTRETWGNGSQIDMFWSATWTVGESDELSKKAHADIASALDFFRRLLSGLYTKSNDFLIQQTFSMNWLRHWYAVDAAHRTNERPRFIHSLDTSLFSQIKRRFPKTGISTLVAGSGFFEQSSADPAVKPEVLGELERLGNPGTRYLVFNTKQSGALSGWISANTKKLRKGKLGDWTFCMPTDPLQSRAGLGRERLHAKYIAGLKRVAGSGKRGTLGALYLGSGNLSRAGLLTRAQLDATDKWQRRTGNVEAGIFMVDDSVIPQVWRALACGDIQPQESLEKIEAGTGEPIFVPRDPPPILFAHLRANRIKLVRSSDTPVDLQLRLSGTDEWLDVGVGENEVICGIHPAPAIVWVREVLGPGTVYDVPVLSEEGLLCRQSPAKVSVDDILDAILTFPEPPSYLPDPEQQTTGGNHGHPPPASASATHYPLRVVASMIEAIALRNSVLTREQFPVWLSQLRLLLLEQTLDADREAVRALGINLFTALFHPGFTPPWMDETPFLKASYERVIADVEKSWCMPKAVACPAQVTESLASGGNCEEEF